MTGRTTPPQTLHVDSAAREIAPDGSLVRPLLRFAQGSMARFEIAAGQTTRAVAHRTVDEIWYVLQGDAQLWRRCEGADAVVGITVGTCVSIPCGTAFQCRGGAEGVAIVAVTMPAWPGDDEAQPVSGFWKKPMPGFWERPADS